jgi:hypothetical protein
MLPTFPKAQKELDEAFNKQMFDWIHKVLPLHLHPPIHHIIEGKNSDFQREDRQIKPLKMERHSVEAKFSLETGKGMTLAILNEKAKEVGEGMGKQMFQSVIGAVDEAVQETGNKVTFKKGELKQEHVFQMLETIQQNFDERGNPTAQLVCGTEFAEELKKCEFEWRNDEEFVKKLEDIRNRKMEEFNEREARRRLVD